MPAAVALIPWFSLDYYPDVFVYGSAADAHWSSQFLESKSNVTKSNRWGDSWDLPKLTLTPQTNSNSGPR